MNLIKEIYHKIMSIICNISDIFLYFIIITLMLYYLFKGGIYLWNIIF